MEIQITAIKFETVNGKKTGKSFSFKADPKKLAVFKTEATLKKKIKEYVAKSGVFKKEELDDLKYNWKDFFEEWKKQVAIVEAEELAKLEASPNNPDTRITPDVVTRLAPNEVFVFGSNEQGMHYGGAAKAAYENFGAIMGQGNGLQGKSYAIPSMSGIGVMGEYVKEFCEFAKAHPEKHFLVTPIGCGIAGFSEDEVAPLFEICRDIDNISLPASFWDIIGEPSAKEYDLERFLTAQASIYEDALEEIRSGRKRGHWIWYIFPQQKGLGHSYNSEYYGLEGTDEARAYLSHPVLGERLREISKALLIHEGKKDIDSIMGSNIDVLKLQTCMNLFNRVSPNDIFEKVLDAFF
jgi:uncharacterized protein (DUF1810 family)